MKKSLKLKVFNVGFGKFSTIYLILMIDFAIILSHIKKKNFKPQIYLNKNYTTFTIFVFFSKIIYIPYFISFSFSLLFFIKML